MLAGHEAGARLLARQAFEIGSILDVGSTVVVRLRWTGLVARAAGPLHQGQVLTAHVAQFVETRGGRIASIETFDCYERDGKRARRRDARRQPDGEPVAVAHLRRRRR